MREAAKVLRDCIDGVEDDPSQGDQWCCCEISWGDYRKIRALLDRPAPDVAKLEAELAELKAKSEAAIKSEERCVEFCVGLSLTDPQQLPLKLLKSSEKIAMLKWQEEQDRILKMTLATQCDSCRDKLAASEAENARLREALAFIETRATQNQSVLIREAAYQALAASPAPPAWRVIADAPKDRLIIAWAAHFALPYIAQWTEDDRIRFGRPHWHMRGAGATWSRRPENQPTHWQPVPALPEPPAREEGV